MIDDIGVAGVVADTGTGGDGGGDGSPADGGTPGGTEIGTPEGGEAPAEGGESGAEEPAEGGEPEPEPEGNEDDFAMDGRRVDKETREALAQFKKINPNAANRIAEMYHRSAAIVKDLGVSNISEAMNKIRGMSATMEALGGEEGIATLNEKVNDYENEIELFGKGDIQLISNLYEQNPEGLELSAAASLRFLGKKDAEAFDRVALPVVVERLEQAGMYGAIGELRQLIIDGDGQKAYEKLQQMTKWMGDAKSIQKQQLEVAERKNPEREQLESERAELAKEKAQHYDSQINSHLSTLCNRSLAKTCEPFFKEMKLPPEGRHEFLNALNSRIWKAQKADKAFQLQATTIKKKGDAQRFAEFAAGNFAEKLPEQFRLLRNQMYPAYRPRIVPKPTVNGGQPTNGQPSKPSQKINLAPGARPKHEQVDWNRTDSIMWINGEAILTNGNRIKFDKNSPANKIAY